jgi:two-component system response regulator (stage 0 sporulation protein F)
LKRILIVDDDLSVGAAIRMMLERDGFATVHALDADTAIKVFESSSFDLVVIDIFIPGNNGIELISRFKKHAPAVSLLAISGFRFRSSMDPDMDFLALATKAGAALCMRKPFTPRQLLAAVHASLDLPVPLITALESETTGKDNPDGVRNSPVQQSGLFFPA